MEQWEFGAKSQQNKNNNNAANNNNNINNNNGNKKDWSVKNEWSDCVNLYFAIQRFTGLFLIGFVAIMIGYLTYCATLVGVPTDSTTTLLPDWTNMGIVETAFDNMDICDSCITTGDGAETEPIPTSSPTEAPARRRLIRSKSGGLEVSADLNFDTSARIMKVNNNNNEMVGKENERKLLQTTSDDSDGRTTELSLDSSIVVYLEFGAESASDYYSECDGDISPDATVSNFCCLYTFILFISCYFWFLLL